MIWGKDANKYNYCSDTVFGCGPLFAKQSGAKEYGFISMQVMRLIFFFTNSCIFFVYFFIYVRAAPF